MITSLTMKIICISTHVAQAVERNQKFDHSTLLSDYAQGISGTKTLSPLISTTTKTIYTTFQAATPPNIIATLPFFCLYSCIVTPLPSRPSNSVTE